MDLFLATQAAKCCKEKMEHWSGQLVAAKLKTGSFKKPTQPFRTENPEN